MKRSAVFSSMVLAASCFGFAAALAGEAAAQPGYYRPPEPAPIPVAEPAPAARNWGIGLRTTGLSITSEADENNTIELQGAGAHLRYRLAPAWRAELTFEGASNEKDKEATFQRSSGMATLGLHYIFNPYSRWNWYAIGGIGRTSSEITYTGANGGEAVETFEEQHFHLGLGLERRFESISIGAELRAVGLSRDDTEGDGERYLGVDGPVPY